MTSVSANRHYNKRKRLGICVYCIRKAVIGKVCCSVHISKYLHLNQFYFIKGYEQREKEILEIIDKWDNGDDNDVEELKQKL